VVLVRLDAVTGWLWGIVSAQSLPVTISVGCNGADAPPQRSQVLLFSLWSISLASSKATSLRA
jgi:hypothetical protein